MILGVFMNIENELLASVIIPAHGRSELLERAVASIINSKNSHLAEIIVVDDASNIPITLEGLRSCDQIIRLENNSGAAVARNIGIKASKGLVIYLMDSDDYFTDRDFLREAEGVGSINTLYYSNIASQMYSSNFPDRIYLLTFFDSIFFKHPHICQTSSLYFHRDSSLIFDESLPKHQDWDFVLFSALLDGMKVERGQGEVYFDRGDRSSLSRASTPDKSKTWFDKLIIASNEIEDIHISLNQIKYFIFGRYPQKLNTYEFYRLSVKLLINKKVTLYEVIKRIYYRNS
jgi:glycosyltransferase involved in cell wall biosynthesis